MYSETVLQVKLWGRKIPAKNNIGTKIHSNAITKKRCLFVSDFLFKAHIKNYMKSYKTLKTM